MSYFKMLYCHKYEYVFISHSALVSYISTMHTLTDDTEKFKFIRTYFLLVAHFHPTSTLYTCKKTKHNKIETRNEVNSDEKRKRYRVGKKNVNVRT